MKWFICIFLVFFSLKILAQRHYFLQFDQKDSIAYFLNQPERYLSERALERRSKFNIEIDTKDLPVSTTYIDSVSAYNLKIKTVSRWRNGVICSIALSQTRDSLAEIDFIKRIECLDCVGTFVVKNTFSAQKNTKTTQTGTLDLGIPYAKELGLYGEGVALACFDSGFEGVQDWQGNINFVYDFQAFSTELPAGQDDHGTMVLSKMASEIGKAPDATYYLFNTEYLEPEVRLEEYNWLIAAEKADSIGVDLISSSLGYTTFDNSNYDYTYEDLGQVNSVVSFAASTAYQKGILVVNSAGNEFESPWTYQVFPAAVPEVLAVGAVTSNETRSSFSSVGYPEAPVKPDVAALGSGVEVIKPNGETDYVSGTSFSCPQISAFMILLKQLFPAKTNEELKQALYYSCNRYPNKDFEYGYGIPDFEIAAKYLADPEFELPDEVFVVNPSKIDKITFSMGKDEAPETVSLSIYTTTGTSVLKTNLNPVQGLNEVALRPALKTGVYLVQLKTADYTFRTKVVLMP